VTLSQKEADELYWRNKTVTEVNEEQQRRFEIYFTKKYGYTVKWCPHCKEFGVEHIHLERTK